MVTTLEPGVNNTFMNSTTDEEDEVRQMEVDWGEAFERKDLATLDRMMADEYILTDPLGNVRSKAESLAAIEANELKFESTESDDVKVRGSFELDPRLYPRLSVLPASPPTELRGKFQGRCLHDLPQRRQIIIIELTHRTRDTDSRCHITTR